MQNSYRKKKNTLTNQYDQYARPIPSQKVAHSQKILDGM